MENIRKHRDIKLVTTDKKRSKLVPEPNYHNINLISEDLSIIEMKKTKVKMKKPIYLELSILEISKILMYEFWYDYMKPKYNDNAKLCYMDMDSFIMNIKTNDFYEDIANDVENRSDTSNYEVNKHLSKSIENAKRKYFFRISEKLNNPNTSIKCYWSLIKTLLNGEKVPCIPPVYDNNRYVTDFKEKCQLFNSYFSEQ